MSLGELREAAILATVIERVSQKKHFCGETFIQKSTFFLKELFGVPFDERFRLYYYGPFSFDLRDRLRSMEADDFVRVAAHQWGATYLPGERFRLLHSKFPRTLKTHETAIDFVVRELATAGVKELEPLATALFITRRNPELSFEARATELNRVKPHIDMPVARDRVQRVDEWIVEYTGSVTE